MGGRAAGCGVVEHEPKARTGGGRAKMVSFNSPIYLRAKLAGTTHISKSMSGVVDAMGFEGDAIDWRWRETKVLRVFGEVQSSSG